MSQYAYIYQADLYCEDCAKAIMAHLSTAADPSDSDDYPQGPYRGEADSPWHCGNHTDCLNAEDLPNFGRVGMFLENPLTTEGYAYVQEAIANSGPSDPAIQLWQDYYHIDSH